MRMKKWMAGIWTAGCLLAPQSAQAQVEDLPVRQVLLGAERIEAYWALGICSVVFVLLVCIWSIQLKHASDRARGASLSLKTRKRA